MQHLEEGTIHAWLDGELSAEEAAAAEAHIRECAQCSALVAEARGLIAASTRILTALDDVPSGVIPPEVVPAPALRKRHWYDRTDLRAAAAVLLVAGASLVVVRSRESGVSLKSVAVADRASTFAPPVESSVTADTGAAKETPQQKVAEVREDDAITRQNAKKSVPPVVRERESATGDREEMNKSVAQAAPPKDLAAPATISADSVSGIRAGALMDFARSKGAAVSGAGRVEGRIIDRQQGKGVEGADVVVQGTNLSVGTDKEGKFKIENVPAGEQRLIVRRIGYEAKTVPLSVKDSAVTANVTLTQQTTMLGAIVTGAAVANATIGPGLKELRSDSTAGMRRTVYEYSPGVELTLIESPEPQVAARRDERRAAVMPAPAPPSAPIPLSAAKAQQAVNTISWTDRGRRYTLSGALPTSELEALKSRLMSMRR